MGYHVRRKVLNHYIRSNPARELLKTETTYVNILKAMVHLFLNPILENGLLDQSEVRRVFSNIETILALNKTLWQEMLERMKYWGLEVKLGDIFLQITEYFKVYIEYVKNYEHALEFLRQRKNDVALATFLETQSKKVKGHERDNLESLLITPVQRIPRYNLLLGEILKYTSPSHPDYSDLVTANEKMQEIARYVNAKAIEAERLEKVHSIQNQIIGKYDRDLLSPYRRYIYEGGFDRFFSNKNKARKVYCFLFNDLLVCCKRELKESLKNSVRNSMRRSSIRRTSKTFRPDVPHFEYIDRITFLNAQVKVTPSPSEEFDFCFIVENDDLSMTLLTKTEREQTKGVQFIQAQIDEISEKITFYDTQKEHISKQKADDARAFIRDSYFKAEDNKFEDIDIVGVRKFAKRKQKQRKGKSSSSRGTPPVPPPRTGRHRRGSLEAIPQSAWTQVTAEVKPILTTRMSGEGSPKERSTSKYPRTLKRRRSSLESGSNVLI